VRSFSQRRQQIVGDCFQLKTDIDVYNGKHPTQKTDPDALGFYVRRRGTPVTVQQKGRLSVVLDVGVPAPTSRPGRQRE
jgi:hypothetical protein